MFISYFTDSSIPIIDYLWLFILLVINSLQNETKSKHKEVHHNSSVIIDNLMKKNIENISLAIMVLFLKMLFRSY